ncbi:MAG: asparagine synthase (glutamine-hydrolyzing) [Lachnospiraceae bacterium]|nr:asparagine synthase (glutamine-hydrolyzing) [Lachnospiraceae bacterium]
MNNRADYLNLINEQSVKSASGRFILTLNGTIYNHKKIAEQLLTEKKVTGFREISDAKVLAEAIEAYGLKEALILSKGMFGLAVYDMKERVLFLARDRVGEKPLFYGFINNNLANKIFVFASDLNTITAEKGFNNPVNPDVLSLYFIHGYVPAPYSIYQDINKLDAGTILEIKEPFTEYKITPYWSMKEAAAYGQNNLFKGSRIEAADELERLLKGAIREQMAADTPAGTFLSGGIDSSTIAALMQSLSADKVKSFTIGMPEGAKNEEIHAKEIAAHIGLDHIEHYISLEDVKDIIPLLGSMFGEPFADSSQIPTYLVSKIARENVTVCLSGDAGDELFCGYNSYRSIERAYRKLTKIPFAIRRPLSRLLLNGPLTMSPNNQIRAKLLNMDSAAELYINSIDYDPVLRNISLKDANLPCKYNELDPRFLSEPNHQMMLIDMLTATPDDILVKVERAAAAASLETRAPLLDKDVVEFAWSLPIDYKRDEKIGKVVLRDVLYRYVPRELMERPKQGFGIPIEKWLKEPALRAWAEQLINRETLLKQGFLNPDTVHFLWDNYIKNDRFIPQIWYILMFQSFLQS